MNAIAEAHPVPKSEYDRNITVVVKPEAVLITYRLEIDAFTLFHDVGQKDSGFTLDLTRKQTLNDFARAFQDRMQLVIPDHILASFNGKALKFQTFKSSFSHPDSVQFLFTLKAPIDPREGDNLFELEDINFPEKEGALKLTFNVVESVTFTDFTEPSQRQQDNPTTRLSARSALASTGP